MSADQHVGTVERCALTSEITDAAMFTVTAWFYARVAVCFAFEELLSSWSIDKTSTNGL